MKKLIAALILLSVSSLSSGMSFYDSNGILWSNICRNGGWYTVYTQYAPVGNRCIMGDGYTWGVVSAY